MNFEKTDTAYSVVLHTQERMMGFDEEYLRSRYLKQNIIMAVLRKANVHSVVICRLIKKINNVNKSRSRGKIDSNFFAYEF